MFTVKYFQGRPHPDARANMTIDYADRVEEVVNPDGSKFVRLTRFPTGMSANVTNETTIPMCSEGVQGPSAVFVENMHGKTVQRIQADKPFPMPPEKSDD